MSRLTRKINGQWDFNSEIGDPLELRGGYVCKLCGEIVPEVFGYICLCKNCFTGDKSKPTATASQKRYSGIEFVKESEHD